MYLEDLRRYCYLRGLFVKGLLEEDSVLDALLDVLQVPGKMAHLRRLSASEKLAAIDAAIESYRRQKTSLWYDVPAGEVLAASIFRSDMQITGKRIFFGAVKKETELAKPVAEWLRKSDYEVHVELATGTKRPDVLGYKKAGWFSSERVVIVELKNELAQLKRGLDQMTTFADYAHEVYLACTPYMAAQYLAAHADARSVHHWDSDVLNNKLSKFGFGLLLVEGDEIDQVIMSRSFTPNARKMQEIIGSMRVRE